MVLEADAVRMAVFLQEKLDKEGLHIKEVDRWIGHSSPPQAERHFATALSLRILYLLLIVLPAVILFVVSLIALVVAMAWTVVAWRTIACVPLSMYVAMEVMVWRSRRTVEEVAEICEKASESRGRSLEDEEFGVSRNPIQATL